MSAAGRAPAPGATLTIALPLPDPLLSINARRRLHPLAAARHTKAQRGEAGWWAAAVVLREHLVERRPYFAGRVRVDVTVCPRPRMKRHDDTAIWEALKPTLDGLEDAGIVANDRQFVVGSLTWATARTGEVILTLTGE